LHEWFNCKCAILLRNNLYLCTYIYLIIYYWFYCGFYLCEVFTIIQFVETKYIFLTQF
jgi:hypothetical protein